MPLAPIDQAVQFGVLHVAKDPRWVVEFAVVEKGIIYTPCPLWLWMLIAVKKNGTISKFLMIYGVMTWPHLL